MNNSIKWIVFAMITLSGLSLFAEPQTEAPSPITLSSSDSTDYFPDKVEVNYSNVFTVDYHQNYKVITISEPWPGADSGLTYVLVQRGTQVPSGFDSATTIEVPIRSIVTMSTGYLPQLEMLDELDTLIGHDAFAWISSKAVIDRIATGAMKEVGSGATVNVELLLDMDPDLIMTFGMGSDWDTHPKLDEAKLPYVINAEWNEQNPLARAEWIKFIALFYNKEAMAQELFSGIVAEYETLASRAASAGSKPTVLIGAPYQGTWWVSGGASFAARLLADAGADYIWADDQSTGSLMMDIETVYERAGKARFWVNTGYWNSLNDAEAADERFANFAAFNTGQIYNNNKRMGPGGGSEYYESGPAQPQKILADLINIFHPGLLSENELYYYKKLD